MKRFACSLRRLGCIPFLTAAVLTSDAATHTVTLGSSSFSPASLSIEVGDTVRWQFGGLQHTVTSETGLWDSGFQSSGFFEHRFDAAGTFPYYCAIHAG
ncbi:MAG: hypothetical protein KIT22_09855, partial [Verrucomicrobiae bacterium]|nr:hypothetical protein [Verrucomicrobiae bacterium]